MSKRTEPEVPPGQALGGEQTHNGNYRVTPPREDAEQSLAVQVQDLAVHYGQSQALFDVALKVPSRGLVVVVGLNGAGKTTLLSAIVGLVRPTSGRIHVFGRSVGGVSPQRMYRSGVVMIPEGRGIFPHLTVRDNLRLGAYPRYLRREPVPDYEDVLGRFPLLREKLRAPAGLLSGGQQQILAIARALMSRPKLLLLDEPLTGLDPKNREATFSLIEDLRAEAATVLMVEQTVLPLFSRADAVRQMRNGTLSS